MAEEQNTTKTLSITAGQSRVDYRIVVDGSASHGDRSNPSDGDTITETDDGLSVIEGFLLGGGKDSYEIGGPINQVLVDGFGAVLVDGEPWNKELLPEPEPEVVTETVETGDGPSIDDPAAACMWLEENTDRPVEFLIRVLDLCMAKEWKARTNE